MEGLAEIAASASEELSSLWDGAGVPPTEQQASLVGLIANLRDLVARFTQEEQEKLDAMRDGLPTMRAEIAGLRDVLGGDVRASPGEDSPLPLVAQYRAADTALEAARALKLERVEQRKRKEEQLSATRAELDGDAGPPEDAPPAPPEPATDEAGGLSMALLGRLQARIDGAMDERAARVEQMGKLRSDAERARTLLGYPKPEEPPSSYAPLTRSAVAAAEAQLCELEAEKVRRETVLADCEAYIGELRAKLQIEQSEWTALPTVAEVGLSQVVLEAYHHELERLETIKASRLGPLLEAARERLRPLWKELHMSEAETRACAAAWPAGDGRDAVDVSDADAAVADAERLEENLEAVEEEERRLRERLESCGRVLSLMAKRAAILEQRAEMVANQKDPSRLLNRRDPGRLLREEKLRVAVEKDLPKMNNKLRELSAEWASAHAGELLTYDGEAIVALVDAQEGEDKRAKEEEKQRKEAEKQAANEKKAAANAPNSAPNSARMSSAPNSARNSARGPPPSKPGVAKAAPLRPSTKGNPIEAE